MKYPHTVCMCDQLGGQRFLLKYLTSLLLTPTLLAY